MSHSIDHKVGLQGGSGTSADPQSLIRSLLNSFPADLNFSDDLNASDTGSVNFNDEDDNDGDSRGDDLSGLLTPIGQEVSVTASTPTLSLPESFEIEKHIATRLIGNKATNRGNEGNVPRTMGDTTSHIPNHTQTFGSTLQQQLPQQAWRCPRCTDTERLAVREKEVFRVQAADARKQLELVRLEHDAQSVELMRVQKISGITEENQRLEIAALKDRCSRLNSMLEAETALRRTNEEKASKFELADDEVRKLRKEIVEVRSTMEQQAAAVAALQQSEDAARKAADDSTRLKDMLQMDKTHLQQEVRGLESRLDEKSRAADNSHAQALALEVKVAQLTDQLLTLQLTARSGFDERMDKEVQRLREESMREMAAMKETSKDILDRENRVLREAKTSLDNECNQLRQRNDTLSQQITALQSEMSVLHHEKNSVISELRAEVKMKGFELTQLGVSFEERMGQLRQGELEIDVLRQELTAHRAAMLRLEGETEAHRQKLQNELDQTQRRLHAYEALEEQIDEAVLRTAKLNPRTNTGDADADTDGAGLLETVEESTQRLLHSVKGIPANPERRVRQAVYLAQKLLDTERQRDESQLEVSQLRKELHEARKQAEIAHENLSRAAQPTSYLVGKLREEESAKVGFINKCKVLENEVAKRKKAEFDALQEAQQLRDRLANVLRQRGELETVKVMLEQLHAIEEQQHYDDDEDDEVDGDNYPDTRSAVEQSQPPLQQQQQQHGSNPQAVAEPTTPNRAILPSEETKSPSKSPSKSPAKSPTSSPHEEVAASAAALGISPELLQQLTSPPREADSYSGQPDNSPPNEQQAPVSDRISPVSYRREAL